MPKASSYPIRILANLLGEDSGGNVGNADAGTIANFSGYIPGLWHAPFGAVGAGGAGAASGSGSIRLYPAYLKTAATLNALGARVQVASAGNAQLAIYANNPATNRPTGTSLVSTASMSTAVATPINSSISKSLAAGLYWWASNLDNVTAAQVSGGASQMLMSSLIGAVSQGAGLGNNGGGLSGLSTPATFGTWPDLTSATFTELTGVVTVPLVQFTVASAP